MSEMQVGQAASWEVAAKAREKADSGPDLYEMMRDAREKASAVREKFQELKPKPRHGDAPIEAYARLARAKRPAEVSAAAGYARRQIARLKAAKRTDPDNAQRIQAAIGQLQKAVTRAGKKSRELDREKVAQARQAAWSCKSRPRISLRPFSPRQRPWPGSMPPAVRRRRLRPLPLTFRPRLRWKRAGRRCEDVLPPGGAGAP